MPRLEIALLGPPEIKLDGNPVKTDRRKAIALLAYLAIAGKAHTRESLAALLWPDYERNSAFAYLRRTLWELNQMLGEGWIEADRDWVRLIEASDFELDTATFEQLLDHTGSDEAPDPLENAISLYRGDFMLGCIVADTAPFENWQNQQNEYFRRLFAEALEKLVETLSAAGNPVAALPHAHRWLELDLLNESAQRAIMRLLAEMGDRTGAIRQYEVCVQTLKDEFGIPPQPETTNLYNAILRGEISGGKKTLGSAPQAEARPASHLPQMPTPFIGRRPELDAVKALITNPAHRLITLVGPGGTGKTRLSIQSVSEVEKIFPDGVFFTSLAPLQTPDAVLPAVAKTLNFSFYQGEETPHQQLLDFLREKDLLLILDNFEHLLSASSLVTDILAYATNVKLVVTSRVRLNVQGEQLFMVTGMRTPDVTEANSWTDPDEQAKPYSAVQLFLDRARRVQPGFKLTTENTQPVLEICRLVQGMPLGLELAAAWLELLPPEDVAAEITRSLDFLETDQADVPERQRSIRAVFESSWKLLSDIEKGAFLRLCVFVGSFSREAAQQVSGASLKTLLALANKSWLQQINSGRFQLHELMRQYGIERLKTDEATWRQAKNLHAEYFATFVHTQSIRMRSPEQPAALRAMEDEIESNLKAAWDWLVAEQRWSEIIDQMLLGLFQFSSTLWRSEELIPWFREARQALSSSQNMLAFVTLGIAEVYSEENSGIKDADPIKQLADIWMIVKEHQLVEKIGDLWLLLLAGMLRARNPDKEVEELLEQVITRLKEQNLRWEIGISLLIQANWWNLYSHDEQKLLEALKIFQELGVIYEQGLVNQLLGKHAFQQKRSLPEIENYFRQAKYFDEQLGTQPYVTIDFTNLAGIYFQEGKFEQGFELLHETQRSYERFGNIRLLVACLNWEGLYAIRYSTLEHTLPVRLRSLELSRKFGSLSDTAWQYLELGDFYRISGEVEKALEFFEQAKANLEKMNLVLGLGFYQRGLGDIALQDKRYADALNHYQEFMRFVSLDNHLWSMGQAHAKLALVHAYSGQLKKSRLEIQNGISFMRDWRENDLLLQLLLAEPVCLKQEGKFEEAIELAAFIAHHPISWNETKQQAHSTLETSAQQLPEKIVQPAIERGKLLNLDAIIASFE